VGRVLVLNRWATRSRGNSQLSLLPHSAIRRRHDERENDEINILDKPGNTSRHRRNFLATVTFRLLLLVRKYAKRSF